jgi:hypothetical protein
VGVEYVLEKGVHCGQRLTDVPPSYVVSLLEELFTDTEKFHTTLTSFIRGEHLGPEEYAFDFDPHRGQNLHDVPVPYVERCITEEMYVDRSTVLDVIITFEDGKICEEKGWVLEGSSQQDVLDRLMLYDYYGGSEEREVGCKGKRGKGDGTQGE